MSKDASETNKRMGLKEFEYKKNKDSPQRRGTKEMRDKGRESKRAEVEVTCLM